MRKRTKTRLTSRETIFSFFYSKFIFCESRRSLNFFWEKKWFEFLKSWQFQLLWDVHCNEKGLAFRTVILKTIFWSNFLFLERVLVSAVLLWNNRLWRIKNKTKMGTKEAPRTTHNSKSASSSSNLNESHRGSDLEDGAENKPNLHKVT